MIVLDANILIRAVLGRRVRRLIDTYAPQGVRFFAPDAAFDDAVRYLPNLLEKAGKPLTISRQPSPTCDILLNQSSVICMESSSEKHARGCPVAMRKTGQFTPALWGSVVPYGRRMPISSVLAWQFGPPVASSYFLSLN